MASNGTPAPSSSSSTSGPSTSLPFPAAAASQAAVTSALSHNKSSLHISTSPPSSGADRMEPVMEVPQTPADEDGPGSDDEDDEEGGGGGGLDFGAVRTVFESPENFTHKHPLFSQWTLYFDNASKADKAKDWTEALQKVIDFDSVEEFWGLYNNIVPPSHIPTNSNYYLFKNAIRPAWEDPGNSKGGKWSVQLPKDKNREGIDRWWLYTMLAAIGETFETPYVPSSSPKTPAPSSSPQSFTNEVTGVIVSSRKAFYRISIWTRSSSTPDRPTIENIGRHFKYGVLGVKEGGKIGTGGTGPEGGRGLTSDVEFQSHRDSMQKRGGRRDVWTV